MERRFVPVAEVSRPHGVQGELRLKLYNEGSDLLARRPPVRLRLPDGSERDMSIAATRPVVKGLLVRFAGVTGRDAADALRGAVVCVARDLFPPLEEGEFYACDLEGARVVTSAGEAIGRVQELQSYPSCDAIVVARDGGGTLEIPLTDSYIAAVDIERRTVEITTLEGLT
ncbi:MAG: 16S rRNA processing protein RimM [Polyangiaceae bacterium]|nr:16S rRNA processing protein RimM [Polyangiaceae bacterium]